LDDRVRDHQPDAATAGRVDPARGAQRARGGLADAIVAVAHQRAGGEQRQRRRWTDVPQAFDPGGSPTAIDVLDAEHVWLLASGAGLWHTTDGFRWRAIGP